MPAIRSRRAAEVDAVVARGAAPARGRAIVCERLGVAALEIDGHGKPFVSGGPWFSIAHGGDVVAVAFATRAVGLDVEPLIALPDLDLLIASYATPREARALAATVPDARAAAFLRLWVRKEAVLKALGVGIAGEEPAAIDVLDAACTAAGTTFRLCDLALAPAHVAAVALAGREAPHVTLHPHAPG